MNVEDQLRAAGRDIAESVRELPQLSLPSPAPGRIARQRRPRGWRGALIPLTAAVAVLAIAIALVAVRNLGTARPTRPAATAPAPATTVPRYYVALAQGCCDASPHTPAMVGDSRTGRLLATVSPPDGGSFGGVTAADDDRTFLLDDQVQATQPANQPLSGSFWYLLRLTPGAAHPVRLTRLPGFRAAAGVVQGVALSPDARELALMVQSAHGVTLRIYSVATGEPLHSWSTPDELGSDIPGAGENTLSLAWAPDGRDLTFTDTPQTASGGRQTEDVRELAVASDGRDLLADSRVILRLPWPEPFLCTGPLVTPDGGSVVCGTSSQYESTATGACARAKLEFVSYSLATGRLARVLATHIAPCSEQAAIALWAGPSGRTAIGLLWIARPGTSSSFTDTLGLIANGRFIPLPSAGVSGAGTAQPGGIAF